MAAVMMSFTSTCNRLDVEPWAYLHDVLTRCRRRRAEGWTRCCRTAGRRSSGPSQRRRRHRLRRATRAKRHLPELAPSIVAPSQPTKELSLVPAVPLVGWWRVRAMTASPPDRHGVRRTDTSQPHAHRTPGAASIAELAFSKTSTNPGRPGSRNSFTKSTLCRFACHQSCHTFLQRRRATDVPSPIVAVGASLPPTQCSSSSACQAISTLSVSSNAISTGTAADSWRASNP